ncbi:hypothetical protein [Mycobacteroides abscessus]|uniref:hypothetical protein n=1 Tax=Mycobacteroides abscessus TaxID=36809 RepID=UPI001F388807|nr:hypothetical protein [Mycobacteroides abscessus]
MSDEPSDAQKLIAEVIATHRALFDGEACDACDWKFTNEYYGHDEHVAVEVDKALGGLKRKYQLKAVDGYYHDVPDEDIYRYLGRYADLESRWVSGWTVTE